MKKEFGGHANKGGVYKITNTNNGKVYFGSAKLFKVRAGQHLSSLKGNKHQNKYLQSSFNKHGADAFLFEVVEVVQGTTRKRRLVEQTYLTKHYDGRKQCYNFLKKTVLKGRVNFSKTPEETRKKMREAKKRFFKKHPEALERMRTNNPMHTPEAKKKSAHSRTGIKLTHAHKKNIGKAHKGKKLSEDHKRKIGRANKGKLLGCKRSAEFCAKISKATKGKKNPFYGRTHSAETISLLKEKLSGRKHPRAKARMFTLWNEVTGERYQFEYACEAAQDLGLVAAHLSAVLSGKRKTHKGFKGEYLPRQ